MYSNDSGIWASSNQMLTFSRSLMYLILQQAILVGNGLQLSPHRRDVFLEQVSQILGLSFLELCGLVEPLQALARVLQHALHVRLQILVNLLKIKKIWFLKFSVNRKQQNLNAKYFKTVLVRIYFQHNAIQIAGRQVTCVAYDIEPSKDAIRQAQCA